MSTEWKGNEMSEEYRTKPLSEEVREYFGEYVKDEEDVRNLIDGNKGKSFFERMDTIRTILKMRGHDVIFRGTYVRRKGVRNE